VSEAYQRHQVHELPMIKAIVTEYQLQKGVCCRCNTGYQATLPVGIPKGMLGPIAMAKVGVLTADYRLSKRNVTYLLNDFYGLKISIGTVSNTEKVVSAALEAPVETAKTFIQQQAVVNADETGHTEKNQKMWTWVCVAMLVAVFAIRASRGASVIKGMLGAGFKGILCTDRWSAYTWMAAVCRQLCWAHLMRDFKKIAERSGESGRIGDQLLDVGYRMFHYWEKVRQGKLSRKKYHLLMKPIRKRIEELLKKGVACPHIKTAGTCKKILSVKEALWTFMEKEGVEPTNNLAEQVLRRIVIWRKTSFGTQSARGTLYMERIMTVVATCKLQKRNVLDFVTEAIRSHLSKTTPPSLLPMAANDGISDGILLAKAA
jgi:transposase